MKFEKRRWICLFAGMVIEACSGISYAWSVFQGPLIEKFQCSPQLVTLVYTGNFWFSAIGFLFLGPFFKRHLSIRNEVLLGSVLYAGSTIASSYATSFWPFFLLFGVLRALGLSLVYPVLLSYALELFPERSGFAGGMMAAGFACGAVIWSPLAMFIYTQHQDISKSFLYLGILFLCCMVPLSFLLENAPDGFREKMLSGRAAASGIHRAGLYDVNRNAMLRMPVFYAVFAGITFALSCGNIMVSQGAPIIRNLFGMTIANAALVVSMMSLFNMLGRVACGAISDRIGKSKTMFLLMCVTTGTMLLMSFIRVLPVFLLCILTVVFSYGGVASLVTPVTAELFGNKHVGENYTVMYCVYAMGSLIGPMTGSFILEKTASYTIEFLFGALLTLIAAGMMYAVVKQIDAGDKKTMNSKQKTD